MARTCHRQGGKFAGSHTTIISGGDVIFDAAAEMPEVTKISLGVIKPLSRRGGSPVRVKCMEIPENDKCLRVTVAKGATVQIAYVYVGLSEARDTVRQVLEGFTAA